MTNRARPAPNDLQEVTTRHRHRARPHHRTRARQYPTDIWQHLLDSLADIPALAAEINRLRAELAHARLDRANLAAAALRLDRRPLRRRTRPAVLPARRTARPGLQHGQRGTR